MKTNEAHKLFFPEYPDVVTVEQMCEMLGGICVKTTYRLLKYGQTKKNSPKPLAIQGFFELLSMCLVDKKDPAYGRAT